MQTAAIKTTKRNYGVDTLRLASMLMILIAHIFTQGGVLAAAEPGTAQYYTAWLMRIFVICDVNCFALISGYAGVNSRFRASRPIALWLEVFAYSVGISALFRLFGIYEFDPAHTLLPVLSGRWWYVTAYLGMVPFTPFIALLFDKMTKKQASLLVFSLVFVLSVCPTALNRDIFRTSFGYSMLWLTALYIIGAYLKRYEPFKALRRGWLGVYALCMLAVFLSKVVIEALGGENGNYFVSFTSLFVLVGSVALLMFFSRISMAEPVRRMTIFLSPMAFGVYLIHVHPCVWNYFMGGRWAFLAEKPAPLLALGVLGSAVAIFLVCAFIDWLRGLLARVLGINKLADVLGEKLTRLSNRVFGE